MVKTSTIWQGMIFYAFKSDFCSSVGPKQFWTCPNWFETVQIVLGCDQKNSLVFRPMSKTVWISKGQLILKGLFVIL